MAPDTTKSSCPLPLGVKQLTLDEMKRHQELGLCFNYEECYHHSHTYKSPALLLLLHDAPPFDSSDKEDSTVLIHDMTKPMSVEATQWRYMR